jgi:hypothetical protein
LLTFEQWLSALSVVFLACWRSSSSSTKMLMIRVITHASVATSAIPKIANNVVAMLFVVFVG